MILLQETGNIFFKIDGLPSNDVEAVLIDNANSIWIGTYDSGLARQTPNGWDRVPIPNNLFANGNTPMLYTMEMDNAGAIWVGTSEGLLKYDNGNWSVEGVGNEGIVWDLKKKANGDIWYFAEHPASIINGVEYVYDDCPLGVYADATVEVKSDGSIYCAGNFGDFVVYDGSNWTSHDIPSTFPPSNFILPNLLLDSNEELWTMDEGVLYRFDGSDWVDATPIPIDKPTYLQVDANSEIIACGDRAMHRFNDGQTIDLTYQNLHSNSLIMEKNSNGKVNIVSRLDGTTVEYDLGSVSQNTLLPTPGGNAYSSFFIQIKSYETGNIEYIDPSTGNHYHDGIVENIYDPTVIIPSSSSGSTRALIDKDGNFWMGRNKFLYMNDGTQEYFFDQSNSPFTPDPYGNFFFSPVAVDQNDNVWINTLDAGMGVWDGTQWIAHYDEGDLPFDGFGLGHVDDQNNFIVLGSEAYKYDDNTDTWTQLWSNISGITNFVPYKDGYVLGTYQDGIYIDDGMGGLQNYNTSTSGILKDYAGKIVVDGDNIWIVHGGFSNQSGGISVFNERGFKKGISVLLEGAYNESTGLMNTNLLDNNVLPLSQPYNQAPYNYNGSEAVNTMADFSTNTVDWILVEVRSGTPSLSGSPTTTLVSQKAALLLDDGTVADLNGDPLEFPNINGDHHLLIRHRNHMDVISAITENISGSINYDFTNDINSAFGTAQLKVMADGRTVMHAGDFNQDGTIQSTDYDDWRVNPAELNTYAPADANLDGTIQNTDFGSWFLNKAKVGIAEIRL